MLNPDSFLKDTGVSHGSHARLPNVDEVINIGYAFHAVDDPALVGKQSQAVARQVVERFLALKAEPGTFEDAYLSAIKAIVLSHGRGLTRKKERYIKDLEAAREEKERLEEQIRESRKYTGKLAVMWKVLGPVILGVLGYLVAQVLSPIVPEQVTDQTGDKAPSILMGLVFVYIGRWLSTWYSNLVRNKIIAAYDSRCYLAELHYDLGKMKENRTYRAQLCEEWKQYTGEDFPDTASYLMIMEGDIETRQRLEDHLRISRKPEIVRFYEMCVVRIRCWKQGVAYDATMIEAGSHGRMLR